MHERDSCTIQLSMSYQRDKDVTLATIPSGASRRNATRRAIREIQRGLYKDSDAGRAYRATLARRKIDQKISEGKYSDLPVEEQRRLRKNARARARRYSTKAVRTQASGNRPQDEDFLFWEIYKSQIKA